MDAVSFLPIILIALLFWLLLIRPQQKRQRAMNEMQAALAVGDEVMLTSGFFGAVHGLRDDQVDIEIAPGTVVTVSRGAVGRVVPVETFDDPVVDPTFDDGEDR